MTSPASTQPPRDAGLTLVELLVTMVVAGIVVPLVVGILVTTQRETSSAASTANAVGDTRVVLQSVEREVRAGAAPLDVADPRALGFWSAVGPTGTALRKPDGTLDLVGRCVQYRVFPDGTLRQRSFAAKATAARPAWSSATRLASSLTSASAFLPWDPATSDASSLSEWVSLLSDLALQAATDEGSVVVTDLEVQAGRGRAVTVTTTLGARNTTTAAVSAPCRAYDWDQG